MTIKEKLNHALAFGYPVRVVFKGTIRVGRIYHIATNMFIMEPHKEIWHGYSAVLSVDLLEPEFIVSVEPLEEVPDTENVYEYIERQIHHHSIFPDYLKADDYCVRTTKLDEILRDVQKKYGDIDDLSEASKLSILDEEWSCNDSGDCVYDDKRKSAVSFDEWKPEIAELPNALRALRDVEDGGDNTYDGYIISGVVLKEVKAILIKLDIESS